MSPPSWRLRDAAVAYASRGIPVLPLHYPLPHCSDLHPVGGDRQPPVGAGCSCRDPGCGQPGKHPLGALVPHGVNDATCNRARVLAWWTHHPQANIGLACGHRFDVLDVDGPAGAHAIRELAATHGLASSGPLVRTGGGGWHFYLAPTGLGNVRPAGLAHVDWRGRGGYVVAPPSRHASGHPYQWVLGRDLDTPLAEVPAALRARLDRQSPMRPAGPVELLATGVAAGDRYARAALAEELALVASAPSATATGSCGSRPATSTTWSPPALSTTARSTKGCSRPPTAAACWPTSPARPAAPWPPAARSACAIPASHPSVPTLTGPLTLRPPGPAGRGRSGPGRGGDGHGRRRPPGRLTAIQIGRARAAGKQSPRPPHHPAGGDPTWAAAQP